MEVPVLRFVREFETHIRFLQGMHPNLTVYLHLKFPAENRTLTFDNEMALEENGAPVMDWTLWNADETEILAYDAAEECETDEGWCSANIHDNSVCEAFMRYTPMVKGMCANRCEVWQKENSTFTETVLNMMDVLNDA